MNGTKLEGKIGRIDNTDLKVTCWDITKKKCSGNYNLIFVNIADNYTEYLMWFRDKYDGRGCEELTEEEFNTLKEGLE